MKYEFTVPELEYYRTFCNFSETELELFNLRAVGIPLEKCAEVMHYDSIRNLSSKVNRKILKVTDKKKMDKWIDTIYWKKILEDTE